MPQRNLAALRARVRRLENHALAGRRAVLPLGPAALDRCLPGGGLPLACLHLLEGARGEWDDGAVTGFALALLARLLASRPGRVLWVSPWRDLYAPGLASQGLDPGRFLLLRVPGEAEGLWALEEALRCRDLVAVVGELESLPRQAARRLQLAAEAGGVTAFLITRGLRPRRRGRETASAVTRWSVQTIANPQRQDAQRPKGAPSPLLPPASWEVALLRCRGAAEGQWRLTWGGDGSLQESAREETGQEAKRDARENDPAAHAIPLAAMLRRRAAAAPAAAGSAAAGAPPPAARTPAARTPAA